MTKKDQAKFAFRQKIIQTMSLETILNELVRRGLKPTINSGDSETIVPQVSFDTISKCKDLMVAGKKIEAIKTVRNEIRSMGLKEAKDWCEAL